MRTTGRYAWATTVDVNDHLAAAAYLMKRHATSTLVVVDGGSRKCPEAIISEADLAAAAARGTDLERTRVSRLVCELALADLSASRREPMEAGCT